MKRRSFLAAGAAVMVAVANLGLADPRVDDAALVGPQKATLDWASNWFASAGKSWSGCQTLSIHNGS